MVNFFNEAFKYSIVSEVSNIENKPVVIVYRLLQIFLLSYIIGYDIILNKGYQITDKVSSTINYKVSGLGYFPENASTISNSFIEHLKEISIGENVRIFDTADYIIPENEYNSIFIMTNFIETRQTPGICAEARSNAQCKEDIDCMKKHSSISLWNGRHAERIPTGKCVNSTVQENKKMCEILGWCPVETEHNIKKNITYEYISNCTYDKHNDSVCPVFSIDYILKEAEPDPKEQNEMLLKGGVIEIVIDWNCDYDKISSFDCEPKYSFKRFDLSFRQASAASGFNFRYANKYSSNQTENRILYKAFGLRIMITVNGNAGKFNILPLMITVGTGIGSKYNDGAPNDYFR